MEQYRAYLALLNDLGLQLEKLAELNQQKTQAVRKDDLTQLNELLKQEQAFGLALRGLERKRATLMTQLNLEGTTLAQLPGRFPPELYQETQKAVNDLKRRNELYRAAAHAARNTLECNLHEIEKTLAQMGGETMAGAGYLDPDLQPPKPLRTDFRA